MIESECPDLTCGHCPGCANHAMHIASIVKTGGTIPSSVAYDLSSSRDETKSLAVSFVHDEVLLSVPKIYETVYVMALKELMTNNMEQLSSTTIQNEIVRIAESIAKISADKFIQQREK